jgi:phenylpropionate dioxygenase-like ring-hydroxylating dioxygenase large terminal subunit
MLHREQNLVLTDCRRGTPMGELYRRYWVPALQSSQLPERAGPPIRVTLLGEQLVAFRDAEGKVGLLSEFCPHRGASLYFGRNTKRDTVGGPGLRCVYHGWKFDVAGRCTDMPSEPKTSNFKDKVQAHAAYPCVERGGVIWAYMGDEARTPALPELEWAMLPDEQRYISVRLQLSNAVQAMEGGIDASHASVLHSDGAMWDAQGEFANFQSSALDDTSPRFYLEETDFGMLVGAQRLRKDGQGYWRFTQWIMPWFTILTHDVADRPIGAHAWVPLDNERCYTWTISYTRDREITSEERAYWDRGGGLHAKALPDSLMPVLNRSNSYGIDRDLQATVSMTGIKSMAIQDAAVQESMGPTVDPSRDQFGSRMDRSVERLGSSDAAVIAARRMLLAGAQAIGKDAELRPPGLLPADQRQAYAVSSQVLAGDADWDGAKDAAGAGKEMKDRPAGARAN